MLTTCITKKPTRRQLLEENSILKDLFEQLQTQKDNADKHCARLKSEVDSMTSQNNVLINQTKRLESQLSQFNTQLVAGQQNIETLKTNTIVLKQENDKLSNQVENLRANNARLEIIRDGLTEKLSVLNDLTLNFGTKVSDIEEKLFKCYYEYRAENRLLHHNNLLHIFLRFDFDNDGVLNEIEFNKFNEYVSKIYQKNIEWPGRVLRTSDLPNLDLKPQI